MSLSIYSQHLQRLNKYGENSGDNNPWLFDTMKSRRSDIMIPSFDVSEDAVSSESRANAGTRLPNSLRNLFDSNIANFDPLRNANFGQSRANNSNLSRDRSPAVSSDRLINEVSTPHATDFVFPPRAITPRKDSTSSALKSDDESERLVEPKRQHLFTTPNNSSLGIGEATMSSSTSLPSLLSTDANLSTIRPGYRDIRTFRGVPDISIPPLNDTMTNPDVSIAVSLDSAPQDMTSVPFKDKSQAISTTRPIINRKRSQSSAASSHIAKTTRNNDFPSEFHFPPTTSSLVYAGPTLSPLALPKHPRQPPAKISTKESVSSTSSESQRSPTSHQGTHSLDNSSSLRNSRHHREGFPWANNSTDKGIGLPPSFSRAPQIQSHVETDGAQRDNGSENQKQPQSRRPTLSRQTSLPVLDSVQSTAVLPGFSDESSDIKRPFAASTQTSQTIDLLPPSPIISMHQEGSHFRMPSLLHTSSIGEDLNKSPDNVVSSKPVHLNTSSPSLPDSRYATDSSTSPSSFTQVSHNASSSFTSTSSSHYPIPYS